MIHPSKTRMKRTRMNPVGKVGRRRIATSRKLTKLAVAGGYADRCEIGPILLELGIDSGPCFGSLTWAHSVKASKRGSDPVLDVECGRSCTRHHYNVLDLLAPLRQAEIVRLAIERRNDL